MKGLEFMCFASGKEIHFGGFVRGCLGFYRVTREGFLVVLRNEILSKKDLRSAAEWI